jgi:hypothetical protein
MEIIITEEQLLGILNEARTKEGDSDEIYLDKVMKSYWDYVFDNAEIKNKKIGAVTWIGFYVGDRMILGCPSGDSLDDWDIWFYDGSYFQGVMELFSIDYVSDFRDSMKRYITKKYGFKISDIL